MATATAVRSSSVPSVTAVAVSSMIAVAVEGMSICKVFASLLTCRER